MVQEEIWWNTIDGSSSKHDGEENYALARKVNKGKGNSSHSKSDSIQAVKKKDLSKIKFFHWYELGHYATKCPHKKDGNKPLGGTAGEALDSQFKLNFTLIARMLSPMMGFLWCLDSGASFHMIGNK